MNVNPLAEPQRIAFAGDWHMNDGWAVAAIERAAEQGADVVVHVGDYGYTFDRPFVQAVEHALTKKGLPLLFVDGNHDDPRRYLTEPDGHGLHRISAHVWHLPRGFRWQWGGRTWLACGGAHSVDRPYRVPGVSWWREETISEPEVQRCIGGGRADILIAHDCPTGVIIPGIDDRKTQPPFPPFEIMRSEEHRHAVRRIVDACRPILIVHGHYHRRYQTHVNLGYGDVAILGLDCDGTDFAGNVAIADLAELAEAVYG